MERCEMATRGESASEIQIRLLRIESKNGVRLITDTVPSFYTFSTLGGRFLRNKHMKSNRGGLLLE